MSLSDRLMEAAAGGPRWILSRGGSGGKADYVEALPGQGGKDWGYTYDASKAKPVTRYWMRRFIADMRRVGAKGVSAREV